MNLRSALAAILLGLVLVVTACQPAAPAPSSTQPAATSTVSSAPTSPALSGEIKIDGSSTVYPISEAVGEEFQKAHPNVKVVVGISGTGGGFQKFCAGEIDISDASRPIKTSEMETCQKNGIEFIELPVAYDALSVVVNPQNDWVACITVEELRKMWEPDAQGKITRWNQVNPQWPDAPLSLYGPGTDSGTFDYFTEAIMGKEDASRGDYTASEDDNVLVQGVANDQYALGYFGLAYYLENQDKLKALAIDGGKGCVLPSEQTVRDGTYQPLSRPLFIYVSRKAADRPEVEAFVRFYLTQGPALVKQVGYIPLPDTVYQLALQRFEARKVGSVFKGGPQVGVSIEDLLKAEQ
ncbi:MAG TPA: PstS family phosphate ABC transporter substrate-binding protein [Thermoflexus sp.]|nr:PstS family phosphate ABC transporter substrate-binding protein [Thermoflexus sp.]